MMLEHHTAKPFPVEVRMTKASVRNCRACGKLFRSSKSGGYCEMVCYRAAQRAGHYRGIRPIAASRIHQCANCGASVQGVSAKKRRNGETCDNVFCDRECYAQFRAKAIALRIRECDHCGKSYPKPAGNGKSRIRFCSAECRNAALKAKPRHCVCCGAWMTPIKLVKSRNAFMSNTKGKVCSQECHIQWIKDNPDRKAKISAAFAGENHPNWMGGRGVLDGKGGRGPGWNATARAIRKRDGYKCQHCGVTQSQHGRALEVHHIIPFHDFLLWEEANRPSNLITLCKSCHTKADWESGKKRGTRRKGKRCPKAA